MTPEAVLRLARERGAKMVDFKFTDLPGSWQHFSVPLHELQEESFVEGFPFDGSSIRGFQAINESDMLVIPDPETAFMDPFTAVPTLSLICNIAHPGPAGQKQPYSRDPRYIAQKVEAYLRSTGIADTSYFGPEAEFYIFDHVRYASTDNRQFAEIDSDEAHWGSGRDGTRNMGHLMRVKEGYFPVAPNDTLQDLRTEMVLKLEELGIAVEAQHHEVGAAGQAEIDIRFNTLVKTADNMHIIRRFHQGVKANIDLRLSGGSDLVMLRFDGDAQFFQLEHHLCTKILQRIIGGNGKVPFFHAHQMTHVACAVAATAPVRLVRIDLGKLPVVGRGVADVIEDVEFGFGTKVASVGDAGTAQIRLGLLCNVTRIAAIWLFLTGGARMSNIADQAQRGNSSEGVHKGSLGIRNDQHIAFINGLETANAGPIKRKPFDE